MNPRTLKSAAARFNKLQTITLTRSDIPSSTLSDYKKAGLVHLNTDGTITPTNELMEALTEAKLLTFSHGWTKDAPADLEPTSLEEEEEVIDEAQPTQVPLPVEVDEDEGGFSRLKKAGLLTMKTTTPKVAPAAPEEEVKDPAPKKAKKAKKATTKTRLPSPETRTRTECPACKVVAATRDQIEELFGFRTVTRGAPGSTRKVAIPQSYCRDCRRSMNKVYAQKAKDKKSAIVAANNLELK